MCEAISTVPYRYGTGTVQYITVRYRQISDIVTVRYRTVIIITEEIAEDGVYYR